MILAEKMIDESNKAKENKQDYILGVVFQGGENRIIRVVSIGKDFVDANVALLDGKTFPATVETIPLSSISRYRRIINA
jgi:hypothetical protein